MKNIIFDFGGVLIEWSSDNFYLGYFNNDTDRMQRFYEETQIQEINKQIDKGLPFDTALNKLAVKFPHHQDAIEMWKKSWHKMLGNKIEGSIQILRQLHAKGYRVIGLTNWSSETFPYVYYTHDFFHLFEDIVVSGREKMIKPDLDIYQLCLSRNNLVAEESVFIDDNLENIIAAQKLGIKGIHFKSPDQLTSELAELGISLSVVEETVS